MKISIAIPSYGYNGKGVECLEFSFKKMEEQTFKDFNVIISDHSTDDELKKLCKKWDSRLNIKYIKNENDIGNSASNMNNAVKHSDGEWVKILCQDDFLFNEDSLKIINDNLEDNINWMATAYSHTHDRRNFYRYHIPSLNTYLIVKNTLGTPSCIIIKNIKDMPRFDQNLTYMYDCEFYHRFIEKHGSPKIIDDVTMGNMTWDGSITAGITDEIIQKETRYILDKHGIH